MKCDTCDNEATVHEVMIKGGRKVEKHLCEHCAVQEGMQPPPVTAFGAKVVSQFILAHGQAVAGSGGKGRKRAAAAALACRGCALSFAEFRKTGLLGCAECYGSFAEQLSPLLGRAHEGGTHHVGKAPPDASASGNAADGGRIGRQAAISTAAARRDEARKREEEEAARRARISTLQRRLAEAVAAEQYERAAQLRDELHQATGGSGQAQAGAEAEAGGGDG